MNRVNKPKNKIAQLFCRHKNKNWYVGISKYHNLSGETRFYICEDCGKVLNKYFAEHEGMGFK